MKQQTSENCSVPIAHDVRPRRGASTRSQGHPSMVPKKKPAKFYRENMLALKFPRHQPCGDLWSIMDEVVFKDPTPKA